jgi:hypothetical protein
MMILGSDQGKYCFISDFLKKEADFGFRMAILGLKLWCLETLSLPVQERDGID